MEPCTSFPTAAELRLALRHVRNILFNPQTGQSVPSPATVSPMSSEEQAEMETFCREIAELQTLIYRDELTGALNRRGIKNTFEGLFNEALFSEEHREHRTKVTITDFSVIFIDLDNFKKINDTYGHDEGDRVLRAVAETLHHHIRGIDAVGRLGGEEFIVALLGASEEAAYRKAQEIGKTIKESISASNDRAVTASIGVASLHQSGARTFDELVDYADKAMYEAKINRGKDTVVRYSELTV